MCMDKNVRKETFSLKHVSYIDTLNVNQYCQNIVI